MKRALLIAGGTVGSLGAVLSITPPTFTSTESASGIGGGTFAPTTEATTSAAAPTATPAASATNQAATAQPTTAATKRATATKSANSTSTTAATNQSTPTPAATQTPAATPTPTKSAATSGKATSGTFTGDPSTMRYGTVQVKITISGGKIVDAVAVQAPSGRDQRYTDMAVPVMRQKTIAAQSSNISGVSGASYTSYAWWVSLQSALSKAGWM